ncbi:MAG: CCA tRNA nucleotidyltransferase [Myxococcaceae bacterium]|nr:CCA tRNA nucleotidyltransferase [Myxococcaceae bacterium]
MLDGYTSYDIDQAGVDACMERTLVEAPSGAVRIGDVINRLQEAGVRVFISGGAPRDWLSGARVKDIDLSIDCPIQRCHAILQESFPGVDPVLIKLEGFGVLRWGRSADESLDISILRSPEAIEGRPLSQTQFQPSGSLLADFQMKDFSINVFYYDCLKKKVLEPCEGSLEDLRARRLRLISHPKKLAVDFRASLRIAQFFSRGYTPVQATWDYLERHADRDILGMEPMLAGWIGEHLPPEVRQSFHECVGRFLREPRAREVLSLALAEGSRGQAWSPPGPSREPGRRA